MARRSHPSVMGHSFAQVPRAEIQRSSFDRSHGLKTTLDAGYLVPVYIDEALPGDTFTMSMTAFGRLATPLFPVMDNMFVNSFFFAVPYRLLWSNWERFNGAQDNPDDPTDYVLPVMAAPATTGYGVGSLSDYFGLPIGVPDYEHVSLWHRAYNLIWNEWFRDENLQDRVVVDLDDGPDDPADYVLLRRGKRHDYFTSCLPWPQKGPAVQLPLGSQAPVKGIGMGSDEYPNAGPTAGWEAGETGSTSFSNYRIVGSGSADEVVYIRGKIVSPTWGNPDIYADLSEATAATINELRQAFQVQRLYERDARGGTRYTEIVRAHFGVVSPDARLQRPEYLGGGQSAINIQPVPQTAPTTEESPQGNLAGYGTVTADGHGFSKSFTEHCVIIGMVSIRADLGYQQGLRRMFSRSTRFDFYWPALAHLGEQAVLNKEIFLDGTSADEDVFGYQERFAEYRYFPSQVTGLFRSQAPSSLDAWHLAQDFETLPVLNDEFIIDDPPIARVVAVPSQPHLLLDCYFRLRAARPMPVFGVPGKIDHF